MIKLMKYLKKSAGYVVLIIGLLFLQAYCDLSLPDYTSKVINVGIQQGGIPDGVPEKMRQSTMENLQIFMDEDTQKEVQDSYVLDGDTYELKGGITGDKREELNDLLCKPLMMYTSFTSGSEESQKMLSQMQYRKERTQCRFCQQCRRMQKNRCWRLQMRSFPTCRNPFLHRPLSVV